MTDTTTAGIPAQPTPSLADTTDLAQVHRVFRDAVSAAPSLIGSATAHGTARVQLVASYYANVLALLHAHHDGEDELIWPLLVERAPDQAAEVLRIAGQHGDVGSALEAASAAVVAWQQAMRLAAAPRPPPWPPSARRSSRTSMRRRRS